MDSVASSKKKNSMIYDNDGDLKYSTIHLDELENVLISQCTITENGSYVHSGVHEDPIATFKVRHPKINI